MTEPESPPPAAGSGPWPVISLPAVNDLASMRALLNESGCGATLSRNSISAVSGGVSPSETMYLIVKVPGVPLGVPSRRRSLPRLSQAGFSAPPSE